MKKSLRKISLNRETLRHLETNQLHGVAGGSFGGGGGTCEFSACDDKSCEVGTSCVHCAV